MTKIYDLSVSLRPDNMETMETRWAFTPHEEAARMFARRHGVKVSALPHGSFFSNERITLKTHAGTHLDAPYHFYPTSEGHPAKRIDEIPLEWCIGDAVVLDFHRKKPPEVITEYDIASELERIGYTPKKGDIVMLHTGGTDRYNDDPRFSESATGMNGGALNYLFRFGVKIMATDSHTIDLPIPLMTERFMKGEKAAYFPIHRAGRHTEWTHAEKLANLGNLPAPYGFKVMFFPVKVARATGAWIRAVAIEDEWLNARAVLPIDLSLPIMNQSFEPEESHISTTHHDQSSRSKAKRLRMLAGDILHAGAIDDVDTYTHAGTHIDAPYHFGPTLNGKRAPTVDELPLSMFYGDAVLLDFAEQKKPGNTISRFDLTAQLDRIGYKLKKDDIVLIRTGAADSFADDPAFADLAIGLEPSALFWLLDQGIKVIGCDAESLDGPSRPMLEALRAGKRESFFPIHYAAREREFCLIHKMNLSGLPRSLGFKIAAFPIKLEGCGAAWTRAVALMPS
jgi:kynurenine formamidase